MANIIDGTDSPETLTGTTGDDIINAKGGNDTVNATKGADTVDGGLGSDALVINMQDLTRFDPSIGAITYTLTGSATAGNGAISSSTGGLNTGFLSISAVRVTDERAGAVTMTVAGDYVGSVTGRFGSGDDVVTVAGTRNHSFFLGLGSNTITAGAGNNVSAIIGVDTSQDFATIAAGAGSANLVSYTVGGQTFTSTVDVRSMRIETGIVGQGVRIDATRAQGELILVDTAYDDVLVGKVTGDIISESGSNTTAPYNFSGGNDLKFGNGGADLYDYAVAAPRDFGDHIADLDADDHLDFSYYGLGGAGGGELIWLGTAAFTGVARQFRYQTGGGNTVIELDLNGDTIADGSVTIDNGEFVLENYNGGGGAVNQIRILGAQNMINGSASQDAITSGTTGADVIRTWEGNDTIHASGGQDFVDGGRGGVDDLVSQMNGPTFVAPTGARTYIIAGDRITDSSGSLNTSFANIERLTLNTLGTAYGDTIDGSASGVALNVTAGNMADLITGSAFQDVLLGNGGNDTIHAGAGNDFLDGMSGVNALYGGVDDDTLIVANVVAGGSVFDGGTGTDTIELQASAPNVLGGYGASTAYGFFGTTVVGIEEVRFSSTLATGVAAQMLLSELPGSGITTLSGGLGADAMVLIAAATNGGTFTMPSFNFVNWTSTHNPVDQAGDSVILVASGNGPFTLNARAGLASVQTLIGASGNDTLNGSSGKDILDGLGGANTLNGNDGNDVLVIANTIDAQGQLSAYTGAGSLFDGDGGFDTLWVGGVVNFQGSLAEIEAIYLSPGYNTGAPSAAGSQPDTVIAMTGSQLAALPANLALSGTGALSFQLTPGETYDASAWTVAPGSSIQATVSGSGGGATITGGVLDEKIYGTTGNDILSGGAGNDRIGSGGGLDQIDGGAGIDTLFVDTSVALASLAGVEAIELGGAALTLTGAQAANGLALATAVTGTGSVTINMDPGVPLATKFWSVAGGIGVTANGTAGTDIFKLGNFAHTVNAGDGADQIKGGAAADTLRGDGGVDKIIGLGGADVLTGGLGNDVFRYLAATDSGLGAAADTITDFTRGQDRLNFVEIDANASLAGDQAFAFLGAAAFSGSGTGEIRYKTLGSDLYVQADVNGDGVADMAILLQGLAGQPLTQADFVL